MSSPLRRLIAKIAVNRAIIIEATRPRSAADVAAYVFVGGCYGTDMVSAASHLAGRNSVEHLAGRDGYHAWEAAWKAGMILGLFGE
jgi:hypothetical protein